MMPWSLLFLLITTEVSSAAEKCFKDNFTGHSAKRHFKLYSDSITLVPLKLSYSRRASQQISTHVLRLLLEEVLGYEDIILVPDDSGLSVKKAVQKLTGCSSHNCHLSSIPEVMINTEVWVPSDYQYYNWVDSQLVDKAGIISTHGRFGWYIPTELEEQLWNDSRIIVDNWRALKLQTVLGHLLHNASTLTSQVNTSNHKESCENVVGCRNGWYYGPKCQDGDITLHCAVLLADFPDHYGHVISQQISSLGLNISVAWLGSKLSHVLNGIEATPYLLLNWQPNTAPRTKMTRIHFPPCSAGVSLTKALESPQDNYYNCDFPPSHLTKMAWGKIQENAPDVYYLLSKLYFDKETLDNLLQKHIDSGGNLTSQEIACDWLQQSRDIWLSWLPSGSLSKVPVYLGGMFPLSESEDVVWSRPGILQGALMALERINQDDRILTNYSLELLIEDTQCKTSLVLNAFIDFMSRSHNKSIAGIIGPACSVQTEIIAETAPMYNTIVMGYSVEGVALADREKFPMFFRTSPSYAEFKYAYATVFEYFEWKQYASLTDTNYVSSTVTATHQYLESRGISLVYSRQITNQDTVDIKTYLTSLQESSAKIIIATLFEGLARAVVCEAYRQGLTPQNGYVWFLPSWLADGWWHVDDYRIHGHSTEGMLDVPCSTRDMQHFVNGGYFSLSNAFFGNYLDTIVGEGTVLEWKQEYEMRVTKENHTPSEYASFVYDGVWAYAVALDKLFSTYPLGLDTIRTNHTTQLLRNLLQETNFTGVSGRVQFRDGERYLPTIEIRQHFPSRVVRVGCVHPNLDGVCDKSRNCLTVNETIIHWPAGGRPSDGRSGKFCCSVAFVCLKLPSTHELCSVESFRAALGISCTGAIAAINAIVIGLFLIVIITLIWICIKRRYDSKYRETQQRMEELGLMEQSPILHLDEWEIPRENIVLNRKLGEGAFGAVCGGEVMGIGGDGEWVPVAVKSLKIGSLPEDKLEFLSEAETMKVFDHKNIVKLLGVCTKGEPAYAVMELMIHGDLKNFLLARRQFANQNCKEADDVTPTKLTMMATDITNGLAYLAEMKFIHRDVALRNCMVGSGYVVKLGDFGMARAMYDSDYYRFGRKAMLPVRWMAPESLADGVFTTKSDVWSLGVTLWELATFGSFPYQGLSNGEVVESMRLGRSMDKPRGCTNELNTLLTECWRKDPDHRPEPVKILQLLSAHPAMVTACLDSPMSSVVRDEEDCVRPDSIRKGSVRSWRGTPSPSPSSKRSRTITQLTQNQMKVLMPLSENGGAVAGAV
ncbi:unnamed protein product [Porites lobata]|uniref:Protein kinase domain-containing protein n=1 Tax=Porites lobata TaxID=104759 RepID=A0ABN8P9I2_9CNID|nr:unnamed protein product [Porites lobata]